VNEIGRFRAESALEYSSEAFVSDFSTGSGRGRYGRRRIADTPKANVSVRFVPEPENVTEGNGLQYNYARTGGRCLPVTQQQTNLTTLASVFFVFVFFPRRAHEPFTVDRYPTDSVWSETSRVTHGKSKRTSARARALAYQPVRAIA